MKKKIVILSSLVGFLILVVAGVSYAYWGILREQTNINKVASGCLDISLVDETKEIVLEGAYPILNSEGVKMTPYTFTVTNTCDIFVSYQVSLNMLNTTTLNSKYLAVVLDKNQIKTLDKYTQLETISGYQESRLLHSGSLSKGDSETFNLRIWMDENVEAVEDAMNKLFQAKVAITVQPSTYSPVDYGFNTLADAMIANEYQSTNLDNAKNLIKNKQAPDFTKTAPIIDWQEIHSNTTSTPTATMIDPNNNNSATPNNDSITKVRFGKGYTFNSETGYYNLTDYGYYDPTAITDYDTTDYYYCGSSVAFNINDVATGSHSVSCTAMYKVMSATKSNTTSTGQSGTVFNMIRYSLTSYAYTQGELESDKSDRGLYETIDDNGTTYYYRGSVNNNYVKFADAYWRIIRLNGDGSVRLLYAGTTPNATGSKLSIGTSAFNSTRNNPAYVGYMYGKNIGVSYNDNFKNETNSTIKTKLDTWYEDNIVAKGLEDRVADSVFCNDRELYSGDGVSTNITTIFKPYRRYYNEKNPTYLCHQANDRFTVSEEKGNGALTYPIGLVTVDDLMYAGMTYGYLNRMSYIYSSQHYWTLSPYYFHASNTSANGFYLNSAGYAYSNYVTNGYGVRAVLNLKSDAQISGGIGTANDPFIVI